MAGLPVLTSVFLVGVYFFRTANTQKAVFRKSPSDPNVAGLTYIQTKRGTKLLTSGWLGVSRHINYFGGWLQSLPFSLAAGLAGCFILPANTDITVYSETAVRMLDGTMVVEGTAKDWGIFFTAFYAFYFGTLLVHRESRDDNACEEKYGKDWDKYKRVVRWRILPGLLAERFWSRMNPSAFSPCTPTSNRQSFFTAEPVHSSWRTLKWGRACWRKASDAARENPFVCEAKSRVGKVANVVNTAENGILQLPFICNESIAEADGSSELWQFK